MPTEQTFRAMRWSSWLHAFEVKDESFVRQHREALSQISDILRNTVQKYNLYLAQTAFQDLMVSIFTVVYRTSGGHFILLVPQDIAQALEKAYQTFQSVPP